MGLTTEIWAKITAWGLGHLVHLLFQTFNYSVCHHPCFLGTAKPVTRSLRARSTVRCCILQEGERGCNKEIVDATVLHHEETCKGIVQSPNVPAWSLKSPQTQSKPQARASHDPPAQ